MGTIIKKSQKYRPKTAKEDFIVYKNGFKSGINLNSSYIGFRYIPRHINKTTFTYTKDLRVFDIVESNYLEELYNKGISVIVVVEGFHSLKTCDVSRLGVRHIESSI